MTESTNPFHMPLQPSDALASVIGRDPISRPQATKKLWEHIKNHDLQDPSNRRMIRIDEVLRGVFPARTTVSMFDLPKMLKRELRPI